MTNLDIAEQILETNLAEISYWAEPDPLKAVVQSPEQLQQSKKGHCWEQTELERYLLNQKNIPNKTYFIDYVYNEKGNTHTHTFLVFKSNDSFYWLEHSWTEYRGIHKYSSINKLLLDVKNKFSKSERKDGFSGKTFRIREYNAPKLPCSHMEYFFHCLAGKEVKIRNFKFPVFKNFLPKVKSDHGK